jgi:chitinase
LPSATTSLLSGSIGLLNNAKAQGVHFSIVNLLTMDYDGADSHMGQEAINAANGFYKQLQAIYPAKSSR